MHEHGLLAANTSMLSSTKSHVLLVLLASPWGFEEIDLWFSQQSAGADRA